MLGLQGTILDLRGPIPGLKGTTRGSRWPFESKVGEKRPVFIFGRGPLGQGALPCLI